MLVLSVEKNKISLQQMFSKSTLRPRIFFVVCALIAASVLLPVLPALLTGAALAFLSEPITTRLHRHFKAPRDSLKATLLSLLTIFVIVAGFLLPFTLVVFGILERMTSSLRELTGGGSVSEWVKGWVQRIALLPEQLSLPLGTDQLTSILSIAAEKSLAWLANTTGELLTQAPGAVFFAILSLFSWGYCLWKGKALRVITLRYCFPWPNERTLIRSTFAGLLKSLVAANILVSLIQASIIGIFLASTGVPHALLWTSLSFFASFVPVVGTLPVTLGAALWCWTVPESTPKAIAMLVCAGIAGTADNFLRPMLARGTGQMDSFWLFLAIMGGVGQFGVAGFIVGPLALALCLAAAHSLRHSLKTPINEQGHA